MCVLRGLKWNLHHFDCSITTNEDIGNDLPLAVALRHFACLGQRQMPAFEQYIFRAHLQDGSCEFLEAVEITDIGLWLAGLAHDEVCIRDVGREKISQWKELVDEGLGCSFGEKL